MADLSGEDEALRHITTLLERAYAGQHSAEQVAQAVAVAREQFRDSHIRTFVPILVERRARAILDDPDPADRR